MLKVECQHGGNGVRMDANLLKVISPYEVEVSLNKSNKLTIIDVRETYEVERGKIPGAIHIPLSQLQNRIHQLEKDYEYVIVCETGSRSRVATYLLNSLGYHAKNMVGGMVNWNGKVSK